MGNSQAVALGHYLQVRDEDYERAASEPTAKAVQNPVQSECVSDGLVSLCVPVRKEKPLSLQNKPTKQGVSIPPAGDELPQDVLAISSDSDKSAAPALHSGGFDADLDRLIELWPMLVADDQAALLAHAEHLAAIRGDAVRTMP